MACIVLAACGSDEADPPETGTGTSEWSCSEAVVAAGNRLMGMDVLDAAEGSSFDDSVALGKEAGVGFLALHMNWIDIEPTPSTYLDAFGAFELFDPLLKAENLKFSLTIRPIDATGKYVPSDLANTRFNEQEMSDRFNSMVDFVFSQLDPSLLTSLQVGNEIDGYDTSGEDPAFWIDYGVFLAGVHDHIRANYPGVKMGFTATHHGITEGELKDFGVWDAYKNVVDIVGVTYYPIKNDFSVKAPEGVAADLRELSEQFPNSTISLQEIGYQTGSLSDSNALKQSQPNRAFSSRKGNSLSRVSGSSGGWI